MTNGVSAYTKAAVFQPGTKTDTLIRFHRGGGAGQPDAWRDPRGSALKFHTSQGNVWPIYRLGSARCP